MCTCCKDLNAKLEPHNYRLTRNMLEGDDAPALIEIHKIETRKRTQGMSMVASFCPFCGKKYPKRKARGVLKGRKAA